MTHKSVLLNEVAEFFRVNSSSRSDFSELREARFLDEPSVLSVSLTSHNSKNSSTILEFTSCKNAESSLDSADSQNLVKNNSVRSTKNSPASWCKKSESKGAEVPPADFLLEAEKRGSPPKSEKRSFWRVGGAGRGVQPFCEKESSEIDREEGAESARDSSVVSLPQNDKISVRVAESSEKSPQDKFANLVLIDATLGLGGHSERLLDENPTLKIIGIDKDKTSLEFAKKRLSRFGERFRAVQGSFDKQIKQILQTHKNIYGILADLGISSPQVDNLERGFSFESPLLDMRMDVDASLDAKFILNNYPKDELARIFREFGEIKGSEKIANLIAESRRKSPIKSGEDLCKIVEKHAKWRDGIHPATLIFQAIRLEVNNELGDLEEFLENIAHLKGTKVAIISFHSLEDRLVKRAFKAWSAACVCDESVMKCECGGKNERGKILTKKPIIPSEREISQNKRARSAKMRCFKFYE